MTVTWLEDGDGDTGIGVGSLRVGGDAATVPRPGVGVTVHSGNLRNARSYTPGLLRQVGGFPEGSPEGSPEESPEGSPEATHPHLTKTLWLTLTQSATAVCAPLSRSSRLVSPDPLGRSPHYPMVSITGSLRIPLDPYGALCDRGCPKGVSKGGTKGGTASPSGE